MPMLVQMNHGTTVYANQIEKVLHVQCLAGLGELGGSITLKFFRDTARR